ncbi:MAG: DNA polymerase III subunit epsilon [Pseudomonadota bacterium]|nr:DNA polymerase III subunit epsilon [Pseudomonadota bacterium]
MRELVLDTETTGLDPLNGDRLVEIGCVEVFNHIATGKTYHQYINPERDIPPGAFAVHGLSEGFLRDFPVFADVADDFLSFIANDPLVIHNAKFDMGFLNAELGRLSRPALPMSQSVDTVLIARRLFPGAPASLDALCRRFEIDNSSRTKHGALLDAELLAEVYLELCGGRQPGLSLVASETSTSSKIGVAAPADTQRLSEARPHRPHAPTADEIAAHEAFVAKLQSPIWSRPADAAD